MCIKTKKPEVRTARIQQIGAARVLWITAGKNTTAYNLVSLASDYGKAFRLEKADQGTGEPEVYDVNTHDFGSCECKGHLRHGHCKHVDCLKALVKAGRI